MPGQKPHLKPRPFKSILLPHVVEIKTWRRAGKTWQEVVDELAKRGVRTHVSACCRFIKRYRDHPYPIGAEPEASLPLPLPSPVPLPLVPPPDAGFESEEQPKLTPLQLKKRQKHQTS